jgi:ornithine cyclodeaminase/alanine dehydrogenase-like protein (mu-crystallin family)
VRASEHPFAGRRTRVLGMNEVKALLDMEQAIEIQRAAFIAAASGHAVAAPNSWLRLPGGDRRGWLKLLAGYDGDTSALGVKVLARFPDNPPGANLGSLLMLFDDRNGFPLAIMDSVYITALRTGAGAALAAEALASTDDRTVGLLGTGVVAWYSLLATRHTNPSLTELRVFSRSEDRREAFAARARDELDLDATAAATVEEAVQAAAVILTATNSSEPVLHERHVRPGALILAMGIRTEIAPELTARCIVVADGAEEAIADGKFSVAIAAGAVKDSDLGPSLGMILRDGPPSRGPDDVVMFDSSGIAIQDVTCARYVWERAEEGEVGTTVNLGLDSSP